MNSGTIEIEIGDVTDIEARIVARYVGTAEAVQLLGSLRGPYCETARTLPAEFPFRQVSAQASATAEALVTDPCLWSPELPHAYYVDIAAYDGNHVLAEYHDKIGLRRLAPRRPVDFAPGTG